MLKIEIKNKLGSVLFEYEKENNTIKDTLEEAIKKGADLKGADLEGADLGGACIYCFDDEDELQNVNDIVKYFEENNDIEITEHFVNRNVVPTRWSCFWNYGIIICSFEKKSKEVKKMTVSEICKELGYEVEIVKEGVNCE